MKEIKYLFQLIRVLNKTDKRFLATTLLETLVFALLPFAQLIITRQSMTYLSTESSYTSFIIGIGALVVLLLAANLVNIHLNTHNNIKGNLIGQKMYEKIFEKCLYMDYEKLQRKEIQEQKEMATMAFAGGSLAQLITFFKTILGNLLIILGVVGVAFFADWRLMIIAVLSVAINGRQIIKAKKMQYSADAEMNPINRRIEYFISMCSDFSVAKEVRLYRFAAKLLEEYQTLYKETFRILKKIFAMNKKNYQIATITNSILEAGIYVFLGMRVLVTKDMNIADFTTYALAVRTFSSAMNQIFECCGEVEKNAMHLKDYFDFLQIESKFSNKGRKVEENSFEIVFDHVSFKYPDVEEYALKDISLTIRNGEKVSIVGENGSGKTTFVKLMLRLYDPTEGNIYLNGINIKEISYEEYLNIFSTVFQDFHIYAFRVIDNITMFGEDKEQLTDEILERIGLIEKIRGLKNGKETYIQRIYDEEGIELSGGQNQKLAIARAIYKDSPIVIMDEPTAALDPRAESEIFASFNDMVKGKTAVYISHRLSSCIFSDNIAVFEKGKLIEYGPHKKLMEKRGKYHELFQMQAKYYIGEVS